ncbi:MAG: endonuclease/exonuclease/phosphatase family protein [Flavobacteriales bacterium]|nr:endonuclease/exonuclease/phosphatase family protein [Flavobacteriales bacterium]
MRYALQLLLLVLILGVSCSPVKPTTFGSSEDELTIAFYNVENLFDTEDDPNKYDEEFTPTGKKAWTEERYETKLEHLGLVVHSLDSHMPDILGVCEVENLKVLEDLNSSPYFKGANYEILHKESPDGRGIDVGLLYNPNKLTLEIEGVIKSELPAGERPNTRLILHASGTYQGQKLHVFVNHWPSRSGGKKETEPNRLTVARNLKNYVKNVQSRHPGAMYIFMGDFNDHPNDPSINEILKAGKGAKYDFENLMWDFHKNGKGSYNFRGNWGALDQFIVSRNLVDGQGVDVETSSVTFFQQPFMMYTNNKGETYPSRTYGGPNYYGGYSDHLPIFMRLKGGVN